MSHDSTTSQQLCQALGGPAVGMTDELGWEYLTSLPPKPPPTRLTLHTILWSATPSTLAISCWYALAACERASLAISMPFLQCIFFQPVKDAGSI